VPNRLADLVASTTLNGIDFVEIASADQTHLRVHFLNTVDVAPTLAVTRPVTITGGDAIPTVDVLPVVAGDWSVDDGGRPVLALTTPVRGDFSLYTLTIAATALDAYYAQVRFTFKAGCPSTLDCLACDDGPAERDVPGPAIDYLAKDYASMRAALLDHSAVAYPRWVERAEPDVGVLLAELLAAVGDDLSLLQDRVALQATLDTATEMVSVVRAARLVDYEPRPATSARTWAQVDVAVPGVPTGVVVQAPQPDGGVLDFELGGGLVDHGSGELRTGSLGVDPRWNRSDWSSGAPVPRIVPYLWDDDEACLHAGATHVWVAGHGFGFRTGNRQEGTIGTAVLLDTAAPTAADPPTREVVHLTGAVEERDELYGVDVTRLEWDAAEALTADHALGRTVVAGNLVPATQGRRHTETYVVDPDPDGPDARLAAVTRTGPDTGCGDGVPVHQHTLAAGRLAWLDRDDGATVPELHVVQRPADPGDLPRTWRWRRSLLDAGLHEAAYTVDPVRWTDVRLGQGAPWFEYDGSDGDTVRHGTGLFGERPAARSVFDVVYRVGDGAAGNVAADSITTVPPELAGTVLAVTNPFAATGGSDAETIGHVRANAPYAFRARQLRAVRAEDYDRTAAELDWVLDAGTEMRWTGSWLSVLTTAQPRDIEVPTLDQHLELVRLLGRRRTAGYEVHTPAPRYVGLDLVATVCAQPWALRGEVEAAVLAELGTGRRRDGSPAFFAPGNLTAGQPLLRSELAAAAQAAVGVDGVVGLRYRRRGHVPAFVPMPEVVAVARDEILRVSNDPDHPDRGSLRVLVLGGK
jgi:predicted phage baseplate assembly protein